MIGLDIYGYGRILGQCMYGSKIYYCMWLHLSKPTDPFVIKPYLPCSEEDKILAKEIIVGRSDLEIVEVQIDFYSGEHLSEKYALSYPKQVTRPTQRL